MQISGALSDNGQPWPLPPGVRLVVEVDAQGVRISFVQEVATPVAPPAVEGDVAPIPTDPESLEVAGSREVRREPARTGLEAAMRVAEERGEDAVLKFDEWDQVLPRSVVRRKIKRALTVGTLPFKTKGKERDGRAKMISARDMIRFLTEMEGNR